MILIPIPCLSSHKISWGKEVFHLEANTSSACRLSKDGDVVRVSSKRADVPVHPGDGSVLVPQTIVS